jgi:hypothetical protein
MSYIKRWSKTTKTIEEGWKQCFKKKAYSSLDLAKQVANKRMDEAGPELFVYACRICGEFHITSKKYNSSIGIGKKVS